MGYWKAGLLVVLTAIAAKFVPSMFEPKLPPIVEGVFQPEFMSVANAFRRNMESGKERGAAFAVYYDGEPLIDMWAGYADRDSERRWRNATVTQAFSVTKGLMAILMAYMVDRGHLNYSEPVSRYWPEFAQNGKADITVEMLLSHQAGLPYLDQPISLFDLKANLPEVVKRLEAQPPAWPPGSAYGYHTITYGLYTDRLIQKVDPQGRDTATIFREEIAEPFGIDFYMNLPREEFHRAARIHALGALELVFHSLFAPHYLRMMYEYVTSPGSLMYRAAITATEMTKSMTLMNNPELREITSSFAMGSGTARGLAKLYSILANGGKFQGRQLLSESVIQELSTPLTEGKKECVTNLRNSEHGRGMQIWNITEGRRIYGHNGFGGHTSFADPTNKLGIAYLTNYMSVYANGDDPRMLDLVRDVYRNLERYLDRRKTGGA